jgi:hypothetical protein
VRDDAAIERRLAREAVEVYLGRLAHPSLSTEAIANRDAQVAQVEVTYQTDEDEPEHAGYFRVFVPYDVDPWEYAHERVHAEADARWPNATYFSIDDTYAA